MNLSLIVAVAADGGIGRRGELLFPIRADLRRFRSLTMGHPLVMGRHTFESLPAGPLPGRTNIVVSRTMESRPGVVVARSLDEALRAAAEVPGGERVFVIGGEQVYRQALPLADTLELTQINAVAEPAADAFFPTDAGAFDVPGVDRPVDGAPWQHDEALGVAYRSLTLPRRS